MAGSFRVLPAIPHNRINALMGDNMLSEIVPSLLQALNAFLEYQRRQTLALELIASGLGQLNLSATAAAPNYTRALTEFKSFDWASIGASIVQRDKEGATIVRWGNHDYVRRSPANKFGEAIWFSRSVGRDEQGHTTYERLITFKRMASAEALPQRVRDLYQSSSA